MVSTVRVARRCRYKRRIVVPHAVVARAGPAFATKTSLAANTVIVTSLAIVSGWLEVEKLGADALVYEDTAVDLFREAVFGMR
jgi:hypothetical protein